MYLFNIYFILKNNFKYSYNRIHFLLQDDAYNSNGVKQAELKWDGGEKKSEKSVVEEA